MTPTVSRALLRQSRFALRRSGNRNASTTADAAGKAKETAQQTAQQVQSKASEGLSRVQSTAGNVASKASDAANNAAAATGGRISRLINLVTGRLIPGTVYYGRVGLELGKIIFEQRKMSPPSLATFQQLFQNAYQTVLHPPPNALQNLRNISTAQWAAAGVVGAEVIGFFTVGEMIGRLKLVGYRGGSHAEHH